MTKCPQSPYVCAQSFGSNSKRIVNRKYLILHVNAWWIRRKGLQTGVYRRHMCVDSLGRNEQSFCIRFQRGIWVFLQSWTNHRISFVSVKSSGASFVPEFFVTPANFADSSGYWGATVRSLAVYASEAYRDFLANTSFLQEQFNDGSRFVFDAHYHFSVLIVHKQLQKPALWGDRLRKPESECHPAWNV
jgi:hypothetical protein